MTAESPVSFASEACSICGGHHHAYLFPLEGAPVVRCEGCGLVRRLAPPDEAAPPARPALDDATEQDAARGYAEEIRVRGGATGKVLLVAAAGHPLEAELKRRGASEVVRRTLAEFESSDAAPGNDFAAAVFVYQLEAARDPTLVLQRVRDLLRPGGVLVAILPSLDSWAARIFRSRWVGWSARHRFLFNRKTFHALLLKTGFRHVWIEPDRRRYDLRHIAERCADTSGRPWLRMAGHVAAGLARLPGRPTLRVSTSGIVVSAEKGELRQRPLLSIILPVFNEKRTFTLLMDSLLAKRFEGCDREILIVESNSTDGTREDVVRYEDRPGVQVILQDRPRGKGYAVRAGFAKARGDIVAIQDADLEYDLDDYDALLEPLLRYRAFFVLGARHGPSWKIRQFNRQPVLSGLANLTHIVHTWVFINLLYGHRLKDPHTMFKVFRRDCLYGLDFECDHFDLDIELVVKLLLKRFTPLEIPVNYRARSFRDGKKIDIFREPFRWVWVDLKNRFRPLRRKLS